MNAAPIYIRFVLHPLVRSANVLNVMNMTVQRDRNQSGSREKIIVEKNR